MGFLRGYSRVSTEEQGEKGYSLENQENFHRRIAEKLSLPFISYKEAVSGSSDFRMELERLFSNLEEEDIVSILDTSRLSRAGAGSVEVLVKRIFDKKAKLYINGVEYDPNEPDSKLLLDINASIAQYFRRVQNKKSREGIESKKTKGEWIFTGRTLVYDVVITNGISRVVVNEKGKEIYLKIKEYFLNGDSLPLISKKLEEQGLVSKLGKKLHEATIRRTIFNPIHAGLWYPNYKVEKLSENIENNKNIPLEQWIKLKYYEPIIGIEDYKKLINYKKLIVRKNSPTYLENKSKYILTGIVYCKTCQEEGRNSKLIRIQSKRLNTIKTYYSLRAHSGLCSVRKTTINRVHIENIFLMSIAVLLKDGNEEEIKEFINIEIEKKKLEIQKNEEVKNTLILQIKKIENEINKIGRKIAELSLKEILNDEDKFLNRIEKESVLKLAVIKEKEKEELNQKFYLLPTLNNEGLESGLSLIKEFVKTQKSIILEKDTIKTRKVLLFLLKSSYLKSIGDRTFLFINYKNGKTFQIYLKKTTKNTQYEFPCKIYMKGDEIENLVFDIQLDIIHYTENGINKIWVPFNNPDRSV